MSNMLAIARKELNGYFASPIAYIIIGFFALVFGWFYVVSITFFMQASLQMGMPGQGQININTMAIRPLLQNVSVVALFVLPLITMRTYAEEKRSGTIELLLTSPLTDAQIVLGKFLGAVALYALMLAVTLDSHRHPVHLRQPGMEADPRRLSRTAADGRVVHLDRPADLEPHEEPDRRRHGDLRGAAAALDGELDVRLGGTDDAEGAVGALDHGSLR